jgi:hypothetical protein
LALREGLERSERTELLSGVIAVQNCNSSTGFSAAGRICFQRVRRRMRRRGPDWGLQGAQSKLRPAAGGTSMNTTCHRSRAARRKQFGSQMVVITQAVEAQPQSPGARHRTRCEIIIFKSVRDRLRLAHVVVTPRQSASRSSNQPAFDVMASPSECSTTSRDKCSLVSKLD